MKIYNVGKDELPDYSFKYLPNYDWIVYLYEGYCYEGSGTLIGFRDNQLYEMKLSHCSCYSPTENQETKIEKWHFEDTGSVFDYDKAICDKVWELLNEPDSTL